MNRLTEFYSLIERESPEAVSRFDILVPYIVAQLKAAGIESSNTHKKAGGKVRHVRIDTSNVEDIFAKMGIELEQVFGSKIATGSKSFSTYKAKLTKKIGDFEPGDYFYVVNRHSEDSRIKGDLLLPTNMGITGEQLPPNEVEKSVSRYVDSIEMLSTEEKDFLKGLLNLKASDLSDISAASIFTQSISPAPSTISADELNKIAVAYGEIVGALWYARSKSENAPLIEFPSGNNPLIDFSLIFNNNTEEHVSAKVGKGAAPSAAVIYSRIHADSKQFIDQFGKEPVELLLALDDLSAVDGVLRAHEMLETESYKSLMDISDGQIQHFTAAGIEKWLKTFDNPDQLLEVLTPFYGINKSGASKDAFHDIFDLGGRRVGLVASPLGYNLAKLLNSPEYKVYGDILNAITQSIEVTQLYTDLAKDKISFFFKPFSSGNFTWEWTSTARDPYKKKFSFRMS